MMIRNAFADAFTNAFWVQKTLEGAWVRGVNWHMRMTAQTSARRRLSRKVKILLIVLAALLLIGGALLFYFERTIGYKSYSDDLVFTSPDGQYRLTVCEWTYFAYSGAELYVGRTADGGRGREAGTTFSDSPNGVFRNRDFHLEWNSDGVAVYYRRYVRSETDDPQTWGCTVCPFPD